MLRRRDFLGAVAAASVGSCTRKPGTNRPNILFAIGDDWSFPHASIFGDPVVNTPSFDRIAREGALFQRAYCCAPSCTPSRSTVLAGRQPWQVGEAGVLYGTIPTQYPLFTHLLEDSGYFTGFTGKGWAPGDWRAGGLTRHPNGREYNSKRHADPVRPGIDPRDYAANFGQFLSERPSAQPFCFWFGGTEPHRAYAKGAGLALGKKLDKVRVPAYWPDTPEIRSDILDYYAEVEWFDTQLGRIIATLERTRQLDNTLVIVTSDNGLPFPRAKVNLYDAGIHMPLAIRWGGGFTGGRTDDRFTSHIDFAPTILQAAGLRAPEGTAGHSLLGSTRAEFAVAALERHTYCRPGGATYPIRAIRSARFQYIRNHEPDRWPTGGPDFISSNKTTHGDVDGCPTKDFMIANRARFPKQYDQCFGKRPAEEFYDLESDPDQVRNLAEDKKYGGEVLHHEARLEAYLRSTGDPRMEGRDVWQEYPYRQTTGFGASMNTALSPEQRKVAMDAAAHKPE